MSWVDLLHLVFCAANPNPDIDSAVWILLQVLAAVTTHYSLPLPSNLARVGAWLMCSYTLHIWTSSCSDVQGKDIGLHLAAKTDCSLPMFNFARFYWTVSWQVWNCTQINSWIDGFQVCVPAGFMENSYPNHYLQIKLAITRISAPIRLLQKCAP